MLAGHPEGPIFAYRERLKGGQWKPDPIQELAVENLQLLHNRLKAYKPVKGSTWLDRLLDKREPPPQGMYLHGGVGRGKSVLMDLFFACAPTAHKRRVHFHAFMLDVHSRIHAWRRLDPSARDGDDPIKPVAKALAGEATLLCLDELMVKDVADAMILRRLFAKLFTNGVVTVITSNVVPNELYLGGLNREQFLPFIDLIETNLDVFHLDSPRDYRLQRLKGRPMYFAPLGARSDAGLAAAYRELLDGAEPEPLTLDVQGRELPVREAAEGIARFSFAELCGRPLGAADYIEVARSFHTVVLTGIPQLSNERRDEARRFVNLIDVLYDHRVNLLCSAAANPDALYAGGHEVPEFGRTVSRLNEMQSESYIAAQHVV
ncbi:MAG: AFG1 family ATPase [Alphaproteobacteria bacterium]|nr:AFG1 family ATPase [Alphaproteobacteria bacterium]